MEKIRTFIAIELPQRIKDSISNVVDILRKQEGDIRWVNLPNLHLTLKFLGDTDPDKIDQIADRMKASCNKMSRFAVAVEDLGVFPNRRRPRVIWIGARAETKALNNLYERIEQEFQKIGFKKEQRGFSPHLTIGRVKSQRGLDRVLSSMDRIEFKSNKMEVDRIVLLKSDLRPQGAIYSLLRSVEL